MIKHNSIPCFVTDVNVVVGSGVSDFFNGDIEIYSQKSNSFESGPNLPYPLQGAASVQYGDTFIVVGGYNSECYCDNSGKMKSQQRYACYDITIRVSLLFQRNSIFEY